MTSKLVSLTLTFPLKCIFIYSNFDYAPVSNRGFKFIRYEPKSWVFPTNHCLTVSSTSGKVIIIHQVTQVNNLRPILDYSFSLTPHIHPHPSCS